MDSCSVDTPKDGSTTNRNEWLPVWVKIGKTNPWIAESWDPPFNKSSFYKCQSADELKAKLSHGNWSLGQAFYLGALCFIQQVDGGDEWLTMHGAICFESITWEGIIAKGEFEDVLVRLQAGPETYCAGKVPRVWWNWDNVEQKPISKSANRD